MEEKEFSDVAQKWLVLINQWKASSKSGAAWCREQALNYKSFCYWRVRFHGKKVRNKAARQQFLELTDHVTIQPGLEIRIRGFSLVVQKDFNPYTLKSCLQVLESLC
jgi:hypothetical protein